MAAATTTLRYDDARAGPPARPREPRRRPGAPRPPLLAHVPRRGGGDVVADHGPRRPRGARRARPLPHARVALRGTRARGGLAPLLGGHSRPGLPRPVRDG